MKTIKATKVSKEKEPHVRRVEDMLPNEIGYIVPWKYNPETKEIELRAGINRSLKGTSSIMIKCIVPLLEYEVTISKKAEDFYNKDKIRKVK